MRIASLIPLFAFAACGGDTTDTSDSGTTPSDADTDADTDSDTDADTDADSDADTDSDTDADTDTDTDTDSTPPTGLSWAADVAPILTTRCTPCHTPAGASGGLTFQDETDLVNVSSGNGAPVLDYIEPGDPATSYLWHKINGTQGTIGGAGSQMPLGGAPLGATDLDTIEQWILDGALP